MQSAYLYRGQSVEKLFVYCGIDYRVPAPALSTHPNGTINAAVEVIQLSDLHDSDA